MQQQASRYLIYNTLVIVVSLVVGEAIGNDEV